MKNNLYQNKYRIPSARLKNWDYRSAASYFVTICSKNRQHIFGKIENKKMILNDLGKQAYQNFVNINVLVDYAEAVNFVIMPNHVHAIIVLKNKTKEHKPSKFGPLLKKSLSLLVNHYKGRVTRFANENNLEAGWQSLFNDHIIRDMEEYKRVFDYITDNPKNWGNDNFNDINN